MIYDKKNLRYWECDAIVVPSKSTPGRRSHISGTWADWQSGIRNIVSRSHLPSFYTFSSVFQWRFYQFLLHKIKYHSNRKKCRLAVSLSRRVALSQSSFSLSRSQHMRSAMQCKWVYLLDALTKKTERAKISIRTNWWRKNSSPSAKLRVTFLENSLPSTTSSMRQTMVASAWCRALLVAWLTFHLHVDVNAIGVSLELIKRFPTQSQQTNHLSIGRVSNWNCRSVNRDAVRPWTQRTESNRQCRRTHQSNGTRTLAQQSLRWTPLNWTNSWRNNWKWPNRRQTARLKSNHRWRCKTFGKKFATKICQGEDIFICLRFVIFV